MPISPGKGVAVKGDLCQLAGSRRHDKGSRIPSSPSLQNTGVGGVGTLWACALHFMEFGSGGVTARP